MITLPHKCEENLGEAFTGSLCHCYNWKPSGWRCHIIQEYWPASCAKVCCWHWNHSHCWPLHPWDITNQIQVAFLELRLLVATDPRAEHQPLTKMSYVELPAIALCNTDSPLCYVDIANDNATKKSSPSCLMTLIWGTTKFCACTSSAPRKQPQEVTPDLYYYRVPEEIEGKTKRLLQRLWLGSNFRVNGLLQVLSLIPFNPRF